MKEPGDEHFEASIAGRNIAWAAFATAERNLRDAEAVGADEITLRVHRRARNDALDNYEWALSDYRRVRSWHAHRRRMKLVR